MCVFFLNGWLERIDDRNIPKYLIYYLKMYICITLEANVMDTSEIIIWKYDDRLKKKREWNIYTVWGMYTFCYSLDWVRRAICFSFKSH